MPEPKDIKLAGIAKFVISSLRRQRDLDTPSRDGDNILIAPRCQIAHNFDVINMLRREMERDGEGWGHVFVKFIYQKHMRWSAIKHLIEDVQRCANTFGVVLQPLHILSMSTVIVWLFYTGHKCNG